MLRIGIAIALAITGLSAFAAPPFSPGYERLRGADGIAPYEAGVVLLSDLGCANCHRPNDEQAAWIVARPAPKLDRASLGSHIRPAWTHGFIANPHETDEGTPMPDVLHDLSAEARTTTADAIIAFLYADSPRTEPADVTADAAAGNQTFHRVGCVACHAPIESADLPAETDVFADPFGDAPAGDTAITFPSIAYPDLGAKYFPHALAQFLAAPESRRPAGRMPNMKLEEGEADEMAAYLLQQFPLTPDNEIVPSTDPEKIAVGRDEVRARGCASCHELTDTDGSIIVSTMTAPALADLQADGGCLSGDGPAHYALTEDQRAALGDAIGFLQSDPAADAEARLRVHLAALNCYACHSRGGIGGPEAGRQHYFHENDQADVGDEGRLPPPLDGVANKLTVEWLHAILKGEGEVRPYMATHMPDYAHTFGETMASLFIEADEAATEPAADSGLEHHQRNVYGRELLGINGLGCVNCHTINGHRSLGMPAVDLAVVTDRLRPAWFKEFLLQPAAYRPRTRMPEFFHDGKSTFPKLFGGDPVKQIEAMWTYLKEAKVSRLPEGMEPAENFDLTPVDNPIVHRTFLTGVGTHAIAVGFPAGVHFAYNARSCGVALAWRGKFLSAESAWADRFTPFVQPSGEALLAIEGGAAAALLADAHAAWPEDETHARFSGYAIARDGMPEFHYTVGSAFVRETIVPAGTGLLRRIAVEAPPPDLYVRVAVSTSIDQVGDSYHLANGSTTIIVQGQQPMLRTTATGSEVIVKPADGVVAWEVSW